MVPGILGQNVPAYGILCTTYLTNFTYHYAIGYTALFYSMKKGRIRIWIHTRSDFSGSIQAWGLQRDVVCLCWPIAPSYTSPNAGGWGVGLQGLSQWVPVVSTAVHVTWHGAQINFGDLPPYLTYAFKTRPSQKVPDPTGSVSATLCSRL